MHWTIESISFGLVQREPDISLMVLESRLEKVSTGVHLSGDAHMGGATWLPGLALGRLVAHAVLGFRFSRLFLFLTPICRWPL